MQMLTQLMQTRWLRAAKHPKPDLEFMGCEAPPPTPISPKDAFGSVESDANPLLVPQPKRPADSAILALEQMAIEKQQILAANR